MKEAINLPAKLAVDEAATKLIALMSAQCEHNTVPSPEPTERQKAMAASIIVVREGVKAFLSIEKIPD